jgi:hypothetical protein
MAGHRPNFRRHHLRQHLRRPLELYLRAGRREDNH